MKKLVYSFAALLGFYLVGCSEVDNLAGDGETQPVVTLYSYDAPANTDPEATVNLRFIPNTVCDKFYVQIEKKADKDAFINNSGEAAYIDKVVSQGTQYPAEITDYLNSNLPGVYAITAVPLSAGGEKGKPAEFIFNGVEWTAVGAGTFTSNDVLGKTYSVEIERAVPSPNLYRVRNLYANGFHIKIEVFPAQNRAVIPAQEIGLSLFGSSYPRTWLRADACTYANGVITVTPGSSTNYNRWTVEPPPSTLGAWVSNPEILELPAGSY
ncbi:MAG: hypothetical protein LBU42_08375 [Prevotellaceae bacterium]|nr:hypothetical protein [Prevotellaceae bacterium]